MFRRFSAYIPKSLWETPDDLIRETKELTMGDVRNFTNFISGHR